MRKLNINIIVILISGVLTVATLPNIDSHGYWLAKTKSELKSLNHAVKIYENKNGHIPTELEGFNKLVEEHYIDSVPLDFWGNAYLYKTLRQENGSLHIYSAGPNGIDNNEEFDDVISSEKPYRCELYSDCPTFEDYLNMVFSTIFLLSFGFILYQGFSVFYKKYINLKKSKDT
jgi:type II secretory pathway pseudopilin PulG